MFGMVVAAKIEDSGRTVREVAAKLKKTPASQFTKWKHGLWTSIDPEKLQRIVEVVSDDPMEQAEMIQAYLYDITPMKFRPIIEHSLKGEGRASTTPWKKDTESRRLAPIVEAYSLDREFAAMSNYLLSWAVRLLEQKSGK